MNILPEMCLWTRKNWLNIGSHPQFPHLDLNPGIFEGFFNIAKVGIFHFFYLSHISGKK